MMNIKEVYQEIKEKIDPLICLAEEQKNDYHLYAIFDTPGDQEAQSGIVYPIESENIETGFVCSTKHYTGYHNISNFIGDLLTGRLKLNGELTNLVYSTAQVGISINRRFLIPLICEQLEIVNLTCSAYAMGLLQNKAHYFYLLSNFFNTPQTFVYKGEASFSFSISSPDVILKPSLECAALGVKKIKNQKKEVVKELHNMWIKFQQGILVQEYIDGYEVCVPVVGNGGEYVGLPPVWVQFNESILTFDLVDNVNYKMVALPNEAFPLNDLIPQLILESQQVISFLGAQGITRVDYRITADGRIYIIDIAALPVLAQTGTCQVSFSALYPNNSHSIFQTLIGAGLFNLPNN